MELNIEQALLEAKLTEAKKHFMTKHEEEVRYDLCNLLIKNNHRQYAKRFWELDLNLVDSTKEPKFIAAISFDEATVFISDAFLKGGPAIFNQLDTVMRHELAHNLMMHQIRMMHVFKQAFAKADPDEAYDQIRCSMSLHDLLNWIEDFEISNKRYSDADKAIAKNLELNGRAIHGLVTEDHRDSWVNMSLETMYNQLSNELSAINTELRNNPNWQPTKVDQHGNVEFDELSYNSAKMIYDYLDTETYSVLDQYGFTLEDIENDAGNFAETPEVVKKVLKAVYDVFKTFKTDGRQDDVKKVLKAIAATEPEKHITLTDPDTGEIIVTLYTADFKALVSNLLKKIIEEPIKLSQSFVDAWTKVMQIVPPENLSNEDLMDLIRELMS
jgi:hypothetical protein